MEAMQARGAGAVGNEDESTSAAPAVCPTNRLISGLAQAAIVVEGDVGSGALITARYAQAQKRAAFAVPGSVYGAASRGPHRLLSESAEAMAVLTRVAEAIGLAIPARPASAREALSPAGASPEAQLLVTLGEDLVHIDNVVARPGFAAAQVAAALAVLEARGLVQAAGRRFARCGPGRAGHS